MSYSGSMDLAFVLARSAALPEPRAVIATARRLGLLLALESADPDILTFAGPGSVALVVALMPAPHPDAPHMAIGPTSPSSEEIADTQAHFIVTILGLDGEPRTRDTHAAALATTVIENVDAVGAMLGHGVVFHRAQLFAEMAALGLEEGALPPELAVDVTIARTSETQVSFLTHGMARYGREEFYVTAPIAGHGALGFVFAMVRWLLTDPHKQLPTGDTVGRTPEERVVVQRVPHPTGDGPDVIRIELP